MTPEQQRTLLWMRRTRPEASAAQETIVVGLGAGQGFQHAVIFPTGEYATARLGELHARPTKRRAS